MLANLHNAMLDINIKMLTLYQCRVFMSWQLLLFLQLITESITITTYAFYVQYRCLYILSDILQLNVIKEIFVKDCNYFYFY